MSTNPGFERFLERIDPTRREVLRKILAGAAVYSAPLIASYSMHSLEGTAQAQSLNQTQGIPATSGWTLAALTAALGAAATWALRRRRDR